MTGSYAHNKKSIYNWVEKNKNKNAIIHSKAMKKYNTWIKIKKIYLNILLDI